MPDLYSQASHAGFSPPTALALAVSVAHEAPGIAGRLLSSHPAELTNNYVFCSRV